MTRRFARRALALWALLGVLVLAVCGVIGIGPAAATTTAGVPINGQGSTYAAPAFQFWTQAEQVQGVDVNYTATGSPAGLEAYANNTADFAGTEGEYSELYADTAGVTITQKVPRGFAYTPDVAGAIAIMYNVAVNPTGSDSVNYLQLSRMTIARIFLGVITNWDSPTITNDNKGLVLPNEPIRLVLRTGESGTTALFYDFVQNTDPSQYLTWCQANQFSCSHRVWEVDNGQGGFPPSNYQGFTSSTQQAQAVASPAGLWSITYDEFAFAKLFHDNVAWVENAAGQWTLPYALNIAAALKTAVLSSDTSQTLKGVYASATPLTYPISAYSYLLYQCEKNAARPTCVTGYANPGVAITMAKFMRYIACTGQIKMATIGYSPLPPQLSQFMANAIGYMNGSTPATLTAKNCANPQFNGGNLGVGALPPKDPLATVVSLAPTGSAAAKAAAASAAASGSKGAGHGSSAGSAGVAGGGSAGHAAGTSAGSTGSAAGATSATEGGATTASGKAPGSTTAAQAPAPVAYVGPSWGSGSPAPLVALFALLVIPAALLTVFARRRRSSRAAGGGGGPGAPREPPGPHPGPLS